MYGFGGLGLSEVQLSISELSVVGGWVGGGGRDKRTSWSDLHRVRQKRDLVIFLHTWGKIRDVKVYVQVIFRQRFGF